MKKAAAKTKNEGASPDALVFATRKGTPLAANNLRRRELVPACERTELKRIGWHTLRHTNSTWHHTIGTPLKVAQTLLGHLRLSTTFEVYTHAVDVPTRDAVVNSERYLFPNPRLN